MSTPPATPGPSPKKFCTSLRLREIRVEVLEEERPPVFYNIGDLNDKANKKWSIEGRVIWRNIMGPSRSGGSLVFTIILQDSTGCIQVAFWGEKASRYNLSILVGKKVRITRGTIFNSIYGGTWVKHLYRISLTCDSIVSITDENVVPYQFRTTPFDSNAQHGEIIDVIGVVVQFDKSKKNDATRWYLELEDRNAKHVRIEMWCEMANEFSQKLEEFSELNDPVVVAFAGLYVISWPAHTYSLLLTKPDSFFAFNPLVPETEALKAYYRAKEAGEAMISPD